MHVVHLSIMWALVTYGFSLACACARTVCARVGLINKHTPPM